MINNAFKLSICNPLIISWFIAQFDCLIFSEFIKLIKLLILSLFFSSISSCKFLSFLKILHKNLEHSFIRDDVCKLNICKKINSVVFFL